MALIDALLMLLKPILVVRFPDTLVRVTPSRGLHDRLRLVAVGTAFEQPTADDITSAPRPPCCRRAGA